jgi:hypothetical protein
VIQKQKSGRLVVLTANGVWSPSFELGIRTQGIVSRPKLSVRRQSFSTYQDFFQLFSCSFGESLQNFGA